MVSAWLPAVKGVPEDADFGRYVLREDAGRMIMEEFWQLVNEWFENSPQEDDPEDEKLERDKWVQFIDSQVRDEGRVSRMSRSEKKELLQMIIGPGVSSDFDGYVEVEKALA